MTPDFAERPLPATSSSDPSADGGSDLDARFAPGPDPGPLVRGALGGVFGAAALLALDVVLGGAMGGSPAPRALMALLAARAVGANEPVTGAAVLLTAGASCGLTYTYGRFRRFIPGKDWVAGLAWGLLLFVLTAPILLPRAVGPGGPSSGQEPATIAWAGFVVAEWLVGLLLYGLVLATMNPRSTSAGALALALTLTISTSGCRASAGTPTPWRPALAGAGAPDVPERVSSALEGGAIFAGYCTECHGYDGRGDSTAAKFMDPPPPDFTDATYMVEQQPSYYFHVVKTGVPGSGMLRWDNVLDDAAVWDAAFYVWSLSTPPAAIQHGQAAYAARCKSCHGSDGAGVAGSPLANAALARDSRATLRQRIRSQHPAIVAQMDDQQVADVVEAVFALIYEPVKR